MVHYSKAPDKTGQRFGMWTVLRRDGSMPYGGAAYICRCDCGTEKKLSSGSLGSGKTTSCGCVGVRKLVRQSRSHGLYKHPLYRAWGRMKDRCYYEKHAHYDRYGGRGITVCERWQNFESFYEDNKDKWRKGLTLDRIDNDKGYSPENCAWVTQKEQNRNRSSTVKLTLNGETLPLTVWAERLGFTEATLRQRRKKGWSDEKTLTTPYMGLRPSRTA